MVLFFHTPVLLVLRFYVCVCSWAFGCGCIKICSNMYPGGLQIVKQYLGKFDIFLTQSFNWCLRNSQNCYKLLMLSNLCMQEMEQSMNMLNSNHELPDVSEFMTRLFSSKSSSKSGSSSSKAGKSSSGKRR